MEITTTKKIKLILSNISLQFYTADTASDEPGQERVIAHVPARQGDGLRADVPLTEFLTETQIAALNDIKQAAIDHLVKLNG